MGATITIKARGKVNQKELAESLRDMGLGDFKIEVENTPHPPFKAFSVYGTEISVTEPTHFGTLPRLEGEGGVYLVLRKGAKYAQDTTDALLSRDTAVALRDWLDGYLAATE